MSTPHQASASSGHTHEAIPHTPWQAPRELAVAARNVSKTYGDGDLTVTALNSVCLDIERGTFTAVVGPSGSGKSTLVHCLAGLDSPDRRPDTSIVVGGRDIVSLNDKQLTEFRREHVGFVFQAFNLVPVLTARQNIELPLTLAGRRPDADLLGRITDSLGLAERLDHRPDELSGGQQQRVAIARALITSPDVIIADEPTGALDTDTTTQVLQLLADTVHQQGHTVVVVTHDPRVADFADRTVRVQDGVIVSDETRPGRPVADGSGAGGVR
ncbi:ABC transporter ATP-binding protein [Kocuria sp. p3-SID1433]|uniref:ABC transporter ATP-binding protein n=1 Tax=unclassified Kocuria TaxID=2649579 RepID=UPI0021A677A5|nr:MULTISPECIES: ABC transporter ATP-binding protein [unclassified Kocuria]MCT1602371.1 ABC transporter ATP-binding protein [Kocuria sp. p3-SID1428]MCT2179930.1 ABC transporter ATP-binding protein [Kocuria sp. p3-SID1433]